MIITRRFEIDGIIIPSGVSHSYFPILSHYGGGWVLNNPSSDTLYVFSSNYSMLPFIARTPSIQSMTVKVFLFPLMLSDRYFFIEAVKKETDDFSITNIVYDRSEKAVFEYTLYNDDFSDKRVVEAFLKNNHRNETTFWQKIEADDLYDAYREGKLKGKLKEIAAGLKEEDNPVIMLVKHRK